MIWRLRPKKAFGFLNKPTAKIFTDVTANTKLSNEILQKSYSGVWTFDAESDGDLDLILSDATVLQNNSDGSFSTLKLFENIQNLSDFVWADLDEDGDGDLVILNPEGEFRFFTNERGGLFKRKIFAKSEMWFRQFQSEI